MAEGLTLAPAAHVAEGLSLAPAAHVAEGLTLAPAAHVAEGLTLAHGTGGASLPSTEPEADEVHNLMYGTVCGQTHINDVRESVEKELSSSKSSYSS